MIKNIYKEEMDIEQALFDALYEMMKHEPIDKISVSDLLDIAHVSRASFYRRFKDKYDLLNKTYENILEKTLFKFREDLTWKESVYKIYEVIRDNHEFFNNALHSQDINGFKNYLYEQAFKLESETLKNNGIDPTLPYNYYLLVGYASSGVAITMKWVEKHADLSLDELVNILVQSVPEEFKNYFC